MSKKRKLKPGQTWGNTISRRTILQLDHGMVMFTDGRRVQNYPVTEKSFRRWVTASSSDILEELGLDQIGQLVMDTIEQAEDGYWLIVRLQVSMRAAVKHLERRDHDLALGVLERQLEKLEVRP